IGSFVPRCGTNEPNLRRSAPVAGHARWWRNGGGQVVGLGSVEGQPGGDHAGPDVGEADVGVVVDRASGADLGGGLVEAEAHDEGGADLVVAHGADLGGAAGDEVLDDGIEGGCLLVVVGDRLGSPEDHDRAVSARDVGRAAGQGGGVG